MVHALNDRASANEAGFATHRNRRRVLGAAAALALCMTPLSGFADDGTGGGEWQYRESIDKLTGEVGWRGISVRSADDIATPYDGPAQVELLYSCALSGLALRAAGVAFYPEDMTSDGSRFFQDVRFVVDEGEVRRTSWFLPNDWVAADRLFGVRRVDEMLAGSWLKLEVKHLVGMNMRKSILTFRTAGWQRAVSRHCPSETAATGEGGG